MAKRLVVPGELVTEERKKLGSHVFVREGRIYSDSIGLVNDEADFASVVPLEGKYMPQMNDVIIGVITSERFAGYGVDINSFYPSFVSKKELREVLKPGSIISAKIMKVNEFNEVELGSIRLFFGGEIIEVTAVKVPRLIGKEGSMLNIIKGGTGSNILVGRNGRVWAKGGNIDLLRRAIGKVEAEAHVDHLTDRMAEFIKANGGGKPQAQESDMFGEGEQ